MFKRYPGIHDNWIGGITQDPSTGHYYLCKTSKDYYQPTGNKHLDIFLVELHNKIQWIKFSQLANMHEMPSLQHGCTHIADWLESMTDQASTQDNSKSRIVILKKIVDGQSAQTYDFYQVNIFLHTLLTNIVVIF